MHCISQFLKHTDFGIIHNYNGSWTWPRIKTRHNFFTKSMVKPLSRICPTGSLPRQHSSIGQRGKDRYSITVTDRQSYYCLSTLFRLGVSTKCIMSIFWSFINKNKLLRKAVYFFQFVIIIFDFFRSSFCCSFRKLFPSQLKVKIENSTNCRIRSVLQIRKFWSNMLLEFFDVKYGVGLHTFFDIQNNFTRPSRFL